MFERMKILIVKQIDLKNKKVALKKAQKENSKLKISEVFLIDDIPNEAKYELEQFFDYIKKKYGNNPIFDRIGVE